MDEEGKECGRWPGRPGIYALLPVDLFTAIDLPGDYH